MRRKKKNQLTRTIFIPTTILYVNFLPWIGLHSEDVGDSIELHLYNEDDEGANLRISGNISEVHDLTDFLLEEIREAETELKEYGYIKV
jgi:hypothetical protein